MRRLAAISLVLVTLCSLTAVLSGGAAVSAPQTAPPVKRATVHYGGAPVILDPRQGTDVTFRARRGDRVTLQLRSAEAASAPCFGRQTLVDRRGARTATVEGRAVHLFRVRTTGRVVLKFRGVCAYSRGQAPHVVLAQLTKVVLREVAVDGAPTRMRGPRRGVVELAYLRVSRGSRDKVVLTDRSGNTTDAARTLVGTTLSVPTGGTQGISVEAGHRYALTPSTWLHGPRLRRGQIVGLATSAPGFARALRAREHRVALDDPAVTVRSEGGREHIISYATSDDDRPYELPVGASASWESRLGWSTYSGGGDLDDPSVRRTIVFRNLAEREGSSSYSLRIRRTVRGPDLVVGGPPVRLESADPGTHFVVRIPSSTAGSVRLSASDVSAMSSLAGSEPSWGTAAPPTLCYSRDCIYPLLDLSADKLVADGGLWTEKEHELTFDFGDSTTGGVTLTLTDIP